MNKIFIITLIVMAQLFAELTSLVVLSSIEKNNYYPVKIGPSLEYKIKNKIGVGINTLTGSIKIDKIERNHYRDFSIYSRYYIKHLFVGASYSIRNNNFIENKVKYVTDYLGIEISPNININNTFDINIPLQYKFGLREFNVSFEFVLKYKFDY